MFLRCKVRRKDGKQHRYWSVVENTRVASGGVGQRHVLYLGEINIRRNWRGGGRSRFWRWRRAAADPVAVSGRSRRGAAGGRLDRRRQTVGIASAPTAAVGRVLAGTDAVARAAARSVLVEAAGSEPQRDAVGSGAVRAGRLPPAGAGQRVAPAP